MFLKNFIIFLISIYKKYISCFFKGRCRFIPGCSEYFLESVKTFGAFKGSFYGILRLLRCNPLFKGGFDPVKNLKSEGLKDECEK